MYDELHSQLVDLLRERSVRRGTFTLASGKTSDLYVDVRQTALHARGSWLIGRLVLARLHPDAVGVGGMTLGADPIAASAATLSTTLDRPVHGFIIRKEQKGHGAGGYLASLTVSLLILRNGRTSDFRMHEQTDSEVSCERISILSEFLPR